MAIILDKYVNIETNADDLKYALVKQGATRFCFDFGFLNRDFERTNFPFALVPFTLSSEKMHFHVDNVEDQMEYKEFDAFIETFVDDDSII